MAKTSGMEDNQSISNNSMVDKLTKRKFALKYLQERLGEFEYFFQENIALIHMKPTGSEENFTRTEKMLNRYFNMGLIFFGSREEWLVVVESCKRNRPEIKTKWWLR
jgi:hypothetical protein